MDDSLRVSTMIGSIYDAALDPSKWRESFGAVRDFVGGASAGIVFKDTARSKGGLLYDDGGVSPDFTKLYFDEFVSSDPCTTGQFYSSVDNPVTTGDLVPLDVLLESRFYQEWAEPQGLVDYMGAAVDRTGTSAVIFNVMRLRSDGMFDDEARERMRFVGHHIRRAAMISRSIDHSTARASALEEVMDGLSAGMFMVDPSGLIVHANRAGELLLSDGHVVRSSGRYLKAADPKADNLLQDAIQPTAHGDVAIGTKGIVMPLARHESGIHVATVLPLAGEERRSDGIARNATAAVFVRKAEANFASPPETIAFAFRLTPMELRVLMAIVDVGGVPQVARELGIAETTVKTHLGRLYEKTGARRQADLAKLVAGFSDPLLA